MSSVKWLLEELDAFAFTETDKQHLTDLLAKSYLLAKIQAYNRAISRTKHVVTIRKPWQPSERDVKQAQKWATTQVDSIAETYETLLQHAIEQMLEQPHEALGDVIGKVKDIVDKIGDWFKGFLPWKTQQIADQTWGTGANDGTEQFIEDALDGNNADEVVDDGLIQVRVRIEPGESSSDYCKNYAGEEYSLEEYKNLGIAFPAHPNCIHSAEIYTVSARDATESIQHIPEIILFLDIDGVFNQADDSQSMSPIPNAAAILRAIDQDSRISPVWLSHWGEQSTAWNDYAGTQHWPVAFPFVEGNDNKALALHNYFYSNYPDNFPLAIWMQDGFEPADYTWAEYSGVKLLDTTEEPIRSLLLSDNVEDAIQLVNMLVGNEVSM